MGPRLDIPKEIIEPEVLREMKTPKMSLPPEFEPHVKEEDLEDLEKRDRKVILSMSVIEQKVDYFIHSILLQNHYTRMVEAESIRRQNAQREINWRWDIIRWSGLVVGAGVMAALVRTLFDNLF